MMEKWKEADLLGPAAQVDKTGMELKMERGNFSVSESTGLGDRLSVMP